MKKILIISIAVLASCTSKEEPTWQLTVEQGSQIKTDKGLDSYRSEVKRFSQKRRATDLVFTQSSDWNNWQPIDDIGPTNLQNAPVFLTKGPNDYWLFGLYGNADKKEGFKSEKVSLPGFSEQLFTTPYPNQYDAKGGLNPSLGGYHAWQSHDMKTWVHHGPVTEEFSKWVTSAEYVDGKTYLYYDYPNDQDPHLYIDEDLTDGVPGENKGLVFKDPSHGSDTAFFRETNGSMHVIYEDWSPINAQQHAWDSPLAGHAVSRNGVDNFEILAPAVDLRTTPTGKIKTHRHPHWQQHPDWDSNIAEYQEHLPIQDAFGDWAMIKVGQQYYLFGDYDKAEHSVESGNLWKQANESMTIARFTSNNLNKEFELVGDFGKTGHPDPDIGFAAGRFYLITQTKDFVSDGPWVDAVEVRAGVDKDNDGVIDVWTLWQKVKETYSQKKGFAKHVEITPASLDMRSLPEGYGFAFEFKAGSSESGVEAQVVNVEMHFD